MNLSPNNDMKIEELDNPTTILLWALSRNGYQPEDETVYATVQTEPFIEEAVDKLIALFESLANEVIGKNEQAYLYGSKQQLLMTDDGDIFENNLAMARNALKYEQRQLLATNLQRLKKERGSR